jgi:hypothetical protein
VAVNSASMAVQVFGGNGFNTGKVNDQAVETQRSAV